MVTRADPLTLPVAAALPLLAAVRPARERTGAPGAWEAVAAAALVYCPTCQGFSDHVAPACGNCGGPLVPTASALLSDQAARRETAAEARADARRVLDAVAELRGGIARRQDDLERGIAQLADRLRTLGEAARDADGRIQARLGVLQARVGEVRARIADVELNLLDALRHERRREGPR